MGLAILGILCLSPSSNLVAENTRMGYDPLVIKRQTVSPNADTRQSHKFTPRLDHVTVSLRDSYSKAYFAYGNKYTVVVSQNTSLLANVVKEHNHSISFHIYAHDVRLPQKTVYGIKLVKGSDTLSVTLPLDFRPKFETDYHGYYVSTSHSQPNIQQIVQHIATINWQKPSDAESLDMNWFKDKDFLSP